jgi:hypothetical protein
MRNIKDDIDFQMFDKTFSVLGKDINTKIRLSFKKKIIDILWVSDVEMIVGGIIHIKYYYAKY